MFQLSSNTTLFLKIFVPCTWLAFFGAFLMTTLLLDDPYIGGFPMIFFRVGLSFFLLLGFLFFYLTVFKLKRVDANEEFLYVSSYFKNFRYPYENIESIKIRDLGILHLATVRLAVAGTFGKKFPFIVSQRSLKKFIEAYPDKQTLFAV
jgi:hypothetical protein